MSDSIPEGRAAQTPLVDLLRAVPKDAAIDHETREGGYLVASRHHPVGRDCHEAAGLISTLQQENAYLQANLATAQKDAAIFEAQVDQQAEEIEQMKGQKLSTIDGINTLVAACKKNAIEHHSRPDMAVKFEDAEKTLNSVLAMIEGA